MFATDILRKEHDVILKMLDATDAVRRRLILGEQVSPDTLKGLLEFFRLFADSCHHGKEEDFLFPLLEKKGIPRGGGPIGVMLSEHGRGCELIHEMELASSQFQDSPGVSGRRWAQAAAEYTNLLREHLAKENDVLFCPRGAIPGHSGRIPRLGRARGTVLGGLTNGLLRGTNSH